MHAHTGHSRALLAGLLALLLAAESRAQSPNLLVSLSADSALPAEIAQDQELVFHAPGTVAHVAWPTQTFALLAGDNSGTQALHTVFGDIDALHLAGTGTVASQGLYFSIPADQDGYMDGDVLFLSLSGLEPYMDEADFVALTGATDGNVDVDAFHLDPDGTVLFSFADNEDSVVLSGATPGVIADGDVMTWAPGAAIASMLYTEAEVNAMVSQAIGATTSTTDTTGLARDPVTGEVLFCVLSPSADDATVFSTAGGGSRLDGHAETDFGFSGAPELDALSVAGWRFPALNVDDAVPAEGASVHFTLRDAEPGRPYVLLASFATTPPVLLTEGWGGLVLSVDPLLTMLWSAAAAFTLVPDASGVAALDAMVPVGAAPVDVYVQAIAPGAVPDASNPLVMELLQ